MTTAAVEERAPLLKHSSNGTPKDNHGEVHYKNISGTRFWCLFLSIVTAYTLVSFDAFFMASSHPVITSYFNASNAAPWLTTVFFLTSTIFGPFYGRISDVTGRRSVYIFTLCVFAITTAWCGAANSIGSFIGARLFCGLGAGGVMGIASVILSDIVKVQYRGIYQSYINMGAGAGSSMGAAFGGVICEALGWRAAFYIQVPLIVVLTGFAVWATPRHLGPSLAKAEGKTAWQGMRSFDFGGAVMLSLCLSGFILGINLGGSILPWGHPVVTVSLAMFALAGLGLVSVERRASRPLLPLGLLSSVPYGNLNWGNLLGSALTASTSFNIPLFLQAVKLATPTQSGLMLLPSLAGGIGTAVCVGFAIARTRQLRPFIATGAIVQFAGTLACGFLQDHMSIVVLLLIIPWTTVGQGFWFPTTTVATLAMTEPEEQAVVVTTLNLSRSLGSIIGVAVSSWILQNALLWFLPRYVTGDAETRSRIIFEVRRSIQAIGRLGAGHRKEAIQAYAASLRAAFLGCAVLGLVLCILVLPVRIPKLQKEGGEQVAAAAEEGHSSADAALDV